MSTTHEDEKIRPGKFSRRNMLKLIGSSIAGTILASCAPATSAAPAAPAAQTQPAAPPAAGPVSITFYADAATKDIYDKEKELFEKAQSAIKLNVEYVAGDEYDTKLSTLAAGGTLGEAWGNIIFGTTYPFAANGIARDLKPYFDKDTQLKLSDIFPAIVQMMTWDNKIICVPFGVNPGF